jgi:hypothetical protein
VIATKDTSVTIQHTIVSQFPSQSAKVPSLFVPQQLHHRPLAHY